MPNIDSLISHANSLERSYSSWNHAYLVLVVITAIVAGVLVLVTGLLQWTANRKHDEFDAAQKAVIAAKDEQLKEDFAHRDERIAKVKADADVSISLVKAESDQKIAAANKRSEEISAKANRDAEELRAKNLETEQQLAKEKNTRAEMEKSLRWRSLIVHVDPENKISDIDPLKTFSGIKAVVEFIPETEARRAARQLSNLVKESGWNLLSVTPNPNLDEEYFDGVVIEAPIPSGSLGRSFEEHATDEKVHSAATFLASFLAANGWQKVRTSPNKSAWDEAKHGAPGYMEPNTVIIKIGLLPQPYFVPEEVKAIKERIERENLARRKKTEERTNKRVEEQRQQRLHPPLIFRPPEPEKPKE